MRNGPAAIMGRCSVWCELHVFQYVLWGRVRVCESLLGRVRGCALFVCVCLCVDLDSMLSGCECDVSLTQRDVRVLILGLDNAGKTSK